MYYPPVRGQEGYVELCGRSPEYLLKTQKRTCVAISKGGLGDRSNLYDQLIILRSKTTLQFVSPARVIITIYSVYVCVCVCDQLLQNFSQVRLKLSYLL